MSLRTIFLSKLFGLYCIVMALAMAAHKETTLDTVRGLMHDPAALMLAGVFALGVGLAMVLGHNVWRGGALPVVVTVIGWLSLVKGVFLLMVTPACAADFYFGALHYAQMFYVYMAVIFLIGVYLTVSGYRAKAE